MALGLPKPILCVTEKNKKRAIPILIWGLPISVWVGTCQYSKLGSPHTNMGLILIWGPTYILPISPLEIAVRPCFVGFGLLKASAVNPLWASYSHHHTRYTVSSTIVLGPFLG